MPRRRPGPVKAGSLDRTRTASTMKGRGLGERTFHPAPIAAVPLALDLTVVVRRPGREALLCAPASAAARVPDK